MLQYLAESYLPREAQPSWRDVANVHLVRLIFVPEDETCLYLLEANSPDEVREAANRLGFTFERVIEAVSVPGA
jgi:hypothetical protein